MFISCIIMLSTYQNEGLQLFKMHLKRSLKFIFISFFYISATTEPILIKFYIQIHLVMWIVNIKFYKIRLIRTGVIWKTSSESLWPSWSSIHETTSWIGTKLSELFLYYIMNQNSKIYDNLFSRSWDIDALLFF